MSNPTYLNCPWCPAQAYLSLVGWDRCSSDDGSDKMIVLAEYRCPAHHRFFIQEQEKPNELRDADLLDKRGSVCCE